MAKYFLDMDMGLDDVADVFRQNGWEYAARGVYGVPEAEDLSRQVMVLAAELDRNETDYIHQGRLAVLRDPEVNGTCQVALIVGYLYNEDVEAFEDA
ncbi:hypothetical protein E1264_03740 [Actinomadura sp. KC216]|uniref:hypothetical protein n=1 Tax=Actinomadura sp. KC216 TaxID=2530370 RepID=UPI001043F7C1|nr:hypothetical protein [Actinomadura sp. KC216]TDB90929.1 hypothetical protein E1264_03740 [Actinomadura sp. KC216]